MVTYTSRTVGSQGWFKTTFVSRQPRPYIQPLKFLTYGTVANAWASQSEGEFSSTSLSLIQGFNADASALAAKARARAYDKIVGKLRGEASAMLAVNIAERKQSFEMIANRAGQLLRASRALLRGDVPSFLRACGFKKRKRRQVTTWVRVGRGRTRTLQHSKVQSDEFALRRKAKTAGSLWLEYWFGWSPLVSDVYAAVNILQDVDLQLKRRFKGQGASGASSAKIYDPPASGGFKDTWLETTTCDFIAAYRCSLVTNSPNWKKANLLGLTNPAVVAWELIPFSFLVDWFLPVGRFLESYTDLVGISIQNITLSEKREASYSIIGYNTNSWYKPPHVTPINRVDESFMARRTILDALPIPGLTDRKGSAIGSLTRAATAVSLLTSSLKTSKW